MPALWILETAGKTRKRVLRAANIYMKPYLPMSVDSVCPGIAKLLQKSDKNIGNSGHHK